MAAAWVIPPLAACCLKPGIETDSLTWWRLHFLLGRMEKHDAGPRHVVRGIAHLDRPETAWGDGEVGQCVQINRGEHCRWQTLPVESPRFPFLTASCLLRGNDLSDCSLNEIIKQNAQSWLWLERRECLRFEALMDGHTVCSRLRRRGHLPSVTGGGLILCPELLGPPACEPLIPSRKNTLRSPSSC